MPAGTFKMGRSETPGDPDYFAAGNADEVPEHNATVSGFYMDKFEVTVGRFRTWVEQYNGTAPPVGAGAHPAIPGSGWDASFDSELPANRSALELAVSDDCLVANDKWTSTVGPNENHAMNCANWYIAFAFCSWDGGRLPTEAERELVASGGEDRLYPWGGVIADATRANYNSGSPGGDVMAVGQFPAGNGRWGHSDLAGNVAEWALDYYGPGWYGGIGNSCVDCANIVSASYRVTRGGRYTAASFQLYTARRGAGTASNPNSGTGIRCAKSP